MAEEKTEKKSRGQPKKFNSPAELQAKIDEYFAMCEEKEAFPDEAGMLLYLGISSTTMQNYQAKEHEFSDEYRKIFETTVLKRESWLARKMAADGRGANGYMNLLKQKKNGGYVDRPVEDTNRTLTIKFEKNISAEDFK